MKALNVRTRWTVPVLVIALFVLALLAMPRPAKADYCWQCFFYFIKGGEFFPPIYFELCSPYEGGGGPWDCYMIEDRCENFGVCAEYHDI